MNGEAVFTYPADKAERESMIEDIQVTAKIFTRLRLITLGFFALSTVLMLIASALSLTALAVISVVGYVLSVIFLYLCRCFDIHCLFIDAYEDSMELNQYSSSGKLHREAKIVYSDVIKAAVNEACTRATFFCSKEQPTSDGESKRIIAFDLNENSPEQGFFLYTAHKLFKTQFSGRKSRRKLILKYGDEDEYYMRIFDEDS